MDGAAQLSGGGFTALRDTSGSAQGTFTYLPIDNESRTFKG